MRRPWIKIETCTPDKPEVCSLATQLRLDEDMVVGKLVRLWSWAELNRVNPNDLGVTKEFIDKLVGRKGFAAALEKTGWLIETDGKLSFRNFKRHNSPVAQNKALTAKRVARHRLRKAAVKEKVTPKTLAETVPEEAKVEEIAASVDHEDDVIIADSPLVISDEGETIAEPEFVKNVTVQIEPEPEPKPDYEPEPKPDYEPEADLAAAPVHVMEEPGAVPATVQEEAPVTAPVEEPATRKRRGKAGPSNDDQPLLF